MMLHHYIWGDIDIDIVEEVAPHFLIAKHYGNLALFCRLTKHQSHYFRNSDKRFYAAGFDDEGKSMNPSDEYIPFVPDILYDDDGIGYLSSVTLWSLLYNILEQAAELSCLLSFCFRHKNYTIRQLRKCANCR